MFNPLMQCPMLSKKKKRNPKQQDDRFTKNNMQNHLYI